MRGSARHRAAAVAFGSPGHRGRAPSGARASAVRRPGLPGRTSEGRRLHRRQGAFPSDRDRIRRPRHAGSDRWRRYCSGRSSLAAIRMAATMARGRHHPDRHHPHGAAEPALQPVEHLPAGGAVRIQQDHPAPVHRGSDQKRGVDVVARRSGDRGGAQSDGARGQALVAMGLGPVAGADDGHDLGVARVHRALVQQVLAIGRPGAQGTRRVPVAALWLRLQRSLRRRRLAPLGSRQRVFHRDRPQQAHRLLRHAAGEARPRRSRSGPRSRARTLQSEAHPQAPVRLDPDIVLRTCAARLACKHARVLQRAGSCAPVDSRSAVVIRRGAARVYSLRDAARRHVVAASRVRGRWIRGPTCQRA